MRTIRLARIAAEAETLRLRHIATRTAYRGVYGVIAAVFAVAALVLLHVLSWAYASRYFGPITAAWIVLGVDVLLAAIFGLLASRSGPDPVEQEAVQVRQTALHQIGQTFALAMLLRPIARRARVGGVVGRLFATGIDLFLMRR